MYCPVLTLESAPRTTPPGNVHATIVVPVCGGEVEGWEELLCSMISLFIFYRVLEEEIRLCIDIDA